MSRKKIFIISGIIIASLLVIALLFSSGIIVLDRSAVRVGEGVRWNGSLYLPYSGDYTEGKTIAKTKDGWNINEVKEDKSHRFIVLRSFIDQYPLVREDYEIPKSGKITCTSWYGNFINDEEFCAAVESIVSARKTDFTYESEAIFELKNGQHMRSLYCGFEGCPLPTEFIGYMGKVNGTWYITTEDPFESKTISCYTIPNEYFEILEKYFE